jgi:hypothetical protein
MKALENAKAPRTIYIAFVALLAVALFAAPVVDAQDAEKEKKDKAKYAIRLAGHIAMSGQAGGMGDKVDIAISGFTTKEQRQALFETLATEGSDALVKAIQESEDLGWVRTPRGRHTLRYVYKFKQEGKTLIIAATDRPLGYGEVMRSDRSVDYNISMMQLAVDEKGKWVGGVAPAMEIFWNEKEDRMDTKMLSQGLIAVQGIREVK